MARASLLAATSLVVSVGTVLPRADASPYVIGGSELSAHGTLVHRLAGTPPLPATTATAFIVADATTGQIRAARDAHGRLAPASTLKTLTAMTALPRLSGSAKVKGTNAAAGVDGTKVGINPGQTYTPRKTSSPACSWCRAMTRRCR